MKNDGIILETIDAHKIYKLGAIDVRALNGINLQVKSGEFVSIMGPSGCGKTTLLNLIGALDYPTKGKVLIDGIDVSRMSDVQRTKLRRDKIGFIFQFYNLIPVLSAMENVELPMLIAGVKKKERNARAQKLLELVELGERAHHRPEELSGGERQRVAIARSLANNPSILLADEITGDLDSNTGEIVMALLRKLNEEEGQTLVVVSHDPAVGRQAERIIWLRDGKVERHELIR